MEETSNAVSEYSWACSVVLTNTLGYRRTGLVIWPEEYDEVITTGQNYSKWALTTIEQTTSRTPTRLESRLAEWMLCTAESTGLGKRVIAAAICKAAAAWGDLGLWRRAVNTCDGDFSIKTLNASKAFTAFGFVHVCEQ